jgi:multicomponent Na+:H+ antiporter subunit A
MTAPAALLAGAGVLLGLLTAPVSRLTDAVAGVSGAPTVPLPAWPGLKPALALSLGTLVLGWAAARLAVPERRGLGRADRGFDAAVAGLLGGARRVTAVLQNGSLPVYLVVILSTVVLVPGSALVGVLDVPDGAVFAESGLQIALGVAAIVAALALAAVGNRLGAVLLLGIVGYGMAGLFALGGAPDLALTQVLVETVTLVVFAIVLARLPEDFTRSPRPAVGPALRIVVAGAVGVFVAAAMFAASSARTAAPVSEAYLERALPEGYGRNVVNVILTDFRALDTFGEIAVVATAALGVAGLAVGIRKRRSA